MKVDPETFFRTGEGDEARAKALCASCPATARRDCLSLAQKVERDHGHGYKYGVWSMMNPSERGRMSDRKAVA
nr:WhiB family transcriptional regulator [Micrococcus sp. TA1]